MLHGDGGADHGLPRGAHNVSPMLRHRAVPQAAMPALPTTDGREQTTEISPARGSHRANEHALQARAGGRRRGGCRHGGAGPTVVHLANHWRGQVREFAAHIAVCGREEVQCPCPGCEERMARAELGQYMTASGVEHLQTVWNRVEEQGRTIAEQNTAISVLQRQAHALQRQASALKHTFTWSTDPDFDDVTTSTSHTFTEGVRGHCFAEPLDEKYDDYTRVFIGFRLDTDSPTCTMHCK